MTFWWFCGDNIGAFGCKNYDALGLCALLLTRTILLNQFFFRSNKKTVTFEAQNLTTLQPHCIWLYQDLYPQQDKCSYTHRRIYWPFGSAGSHLSCRHAEWFHRTELGLQCVLQRQSIILFWGIKEWFWYLVLTCSVSHTLEAKHWSVTPPLLDIQLLTPNFNLRVLPWLLLFGAFQMSLSAVTYRMQAASKYNLNPQTNISNIFVGKKNSFSFC